MADPMDSPRSRRFRAADLTAEDKKRALTDLAGVIWNAWAAFLDETTVDSSRPAPLWAQLDQHSRELFLLNFPWDTQASIFGGVISRHERTRN